jgi:hypothetical protein
MAPAHLCFHVSEVALRRIEATPVTGMYPAEKPAVRIVNADPVRSPSQQTHMSAGTCYAHETFEVKSDLRRVLQPPIPC